MGNGQEWIEPQKPQKNVFRESPPGRGAEGGVGFSNAWNLFFQPLEKPRTESFPSATSSDSGRIKMHKKRVVCPWVGSAIRGRFALLCPDK